MKNVFDKLTDQSKKQVLMFNSGLGENFRVIRMFFNILDEQSNEKLYNKILCNIFLLYNDILCLMPSMGSLSMSKIMKNDNGKFFFNDFINKVKEYYNDNYIMFTDSGGFQIATGVWDKTKINEKFVINLFNIMYDYSDIITTLDVPIVISNEQDEMKKIEIYKQNFNITYTNNKIYAQLLQNKEVKKPVCNMIHGISLYSIEEWINKMTEFNELFGYMWGVNINTTDESGVNNSLRIFYPFFYIVHNDIECKWFHYMGISGIKQYVILAMIKTALYNNNIPIIISNDRSDLVQRCKFNRLTYTMISKNILVYKDIPFGNRLKEIINSNLCIDDVEEKYLNENLIDSSIFNTLYSIYPNKSIDIFSSIAGLIFKEHFTFNNYNNEDYNRKAVSYSYIHNNYEYNKFFNFIDILLKTNDLQIYNQFFDKETAEILYQTQCVLNDLFADKNNLIDKFEKNKEFLTNKLIRKGLKIFRFISDKDVHMNTENSLL